MRSGAIRVLAFGGATLAMAVAAVAGPAQLSPRLRERLQAEPAALHPVWVFFADKGPDADQRLSEGLAWLTPRALSRRERRGVRGAGPDLQDLPVPTAYLQAVAARVTGLRQVSRWFNAVSVDATAAELEAVAELPFVARLDRVARFRRAPEPLAAGPRAASRTRAGEHLIDYGGGLNQVEQLGVPLLHDLGFQGQDVVIALLDAGFDNLSHEAFSAASIAAAWDFVNGDPDVGDGEDMGEGSHGTAVLSAIGGYAPGQLVGPAFAATYILAKTENTESETEVEEDNWAAAAEWAESLGAEVISTSLGYLSFDGGTGYTFEDMDGATAVSTLAAQRAVELGVVVVTSAGNAGAHPLHNTLGAPADGIFVISAGAVDALGERASFSSVGPTADGRIKPDLMAQGQAVVVASSISVSGYRLGNGTSFACPLIAGVAALVLQAHPDYTVFQVIEALRSTASRAAAPDNRYGWGIPDALRALALDLTPDRD